MCGDPSHELCLSGWRKTANRFPHQALRALGLFPLGTKAQVTAVGFLWGWGGGVRALAVATARGRAVCRSRRPPRPRASLRSYFGSPRPARRGCLVQTRPQVAREAEGKSPPSAALQTPAELGSSQENLGNAAGSLSRIRGEGEQESCGFGVTLGVPFITELCVQAEATVVSYGPCLCGAYSLVVETD